jgi:hypothetical protein
MMSARDMSLIALVCAAVWAGFAFITSVATTCIGMPLGLLGLVLGVWALIQNHGDREERVGLFAGGALALVVVGGVLQWFPILGMVVIFANGVTSLFSTPAP